MGPKPLEEDELDMSTSSTATATSPGRSRTKKDCNGLLSYSSKNMASSSKKRLSIIATESDDDDEATNHNNHSQSLKGLSECEQVYGPYPRALPIPYLNKQKETPSTESNARTTFDVKQSDYRDVGTPDEWLPRDGRLVRLTGRHPFNVEPPLSIHAQYKFITPTTLQYVRNHGACPKLTWEDHRLHVGGPLVSSPLVLSMDEIAEMTPRELPVTLVCAGNRRKEQNMIRQTIGFNWGPSGVSTSVWKGVLLRDLLLKAGVSMKNMGTKHVEFIGVEDLPNKIGPGPFEDEPWGKLVKYGTSVPLSRAMNSAYDIIIAYEANGEKLEPDHGFPLRLVIPGYIGGRMIKWLKHINVIEHETKNHYHYHDNRILPPHITSNESIEGNWWYKPEYIFNELNINSAIAKPDHEERLSIAENIASTYPITGYAYTGGGRMISRVEVSIDGGIHWNLASIERKERPTDHGKYWCWIWWEYNIAVADLIDTKQIVCRAWDEANNVQPLDATWNLMGMGNNQVFRVNVHVEKGEQGHAFRFEHPTQPGQEKGGWMTKIGSKPKSAGFGNLLEIRALEESSSKGASVTAKESSDAKKFTMQEIEKHNTEKDVWIVIKDRVYDCTEYLDLHPGGADSITINAGDDATEDFIAIHSEKATKMLEKFYIGDLDTTSIIDEKQQQEALAITDQKGNEIALNPKKKMSYKLQKKVVLSHDSFLLDFALPSPNHILGLPTGKHVFLSARIDNEMVMRRYTPISSNFDVGCVKFVIKAYRPCPPRFPSGGKMSQHLDSLSIGDTIDIRGPVGEFDYISEGNFLLEGEERHANSFNMIAGGTGITPVMQIAAEILRNPKDKTKMSLIFACREENDLLMRSTLDQWANMFPDKFKVHYVLSDAWPTNWKYSTGFVNKSLFEQQLYPSSSPDVYNLMCGPPIMLEKGCVPNLVALDHKKERIFSF